MIKVMGESFKYEWVGLTFVLKFAANLLQIFEHNLQAYKILDRIYTFFLVILFLTENSSKRFLQNVLLLQ